MNKKKEHTRKNPRKTVAKAKKAAKHRPATHASRPSQTIEHASKAPFKPNHVSSPLGQLKEKPNFEINLDRIHGGTVLGDLMVVFPRTREVLKKYGLNLEVDEAGDIYMSLEAFAALKGLKTESVIQELEAASKEPPPSTSPPMTVQTVA